MTLWFAPLSWAILVLLPHATGLADSDEPGSSAPPAASSCVEVHARVRYSMGYDHLVDLKNNCKKPVVCQVATDVNPKKQAARLKVGQHSTLVTFLGSPAREFTPQVVCDYQ